MSRVLVIGAGLGGLAAAIHLARRGHMVTVLEKTGAVGGKMGTWSDSGYTFDTGPTLLTMPFVLDTLFADCGRRREDALELVPLDPLCRYRFSDGAVLDATSDRARMTRAIAGVSPADAEAYAPFMDHARGVYEAASEPFLFSPFVPDSMLGLMKALRYLPSVLRIDAFRTLDAAVRSWFKDPRLQQLFNRFATYNGSSPYRAPATLALIPYVEFAMGGWYVRGGMIRLAEVLRSLAADLGVDIQTGCEVSRVLVKNGRAGGVHTVNGQRFDADAVVCNADALYAIRKLLDPEAGGASGRYRKAEASLAGFVLLLGIRRLYPSLVHHNIFFSADYPAEFRSLLDDSRPAPDPTVYVSVSSRTDPDHAPPGCSNMFVLVNAPPVNGEFDWAEQAAAYREVVLGTLERHGLTGIRGAIETERRITPADFASTFNAYRGAIYGPSSNGPMSAFLRPPNRWPGIRGLYFAGGSAHPGGGIPLVLLSGAIAAGLVHEDLGPPVSVTVPS